ncbi:MAG: ubiquitin-like domain-containing protein [Candidatus Promineifilaceae bacterium]
MRATKLGLIAFFSSLILGGLAVATFALLQVKPYTVYVDGEVVQVRGSFNAVAEVVQAAEVMLGNGDTTVPSLNSPASAETAIQILRAKAVRLITDDRSQVYYTQQPTIGAFFNDIGLSVGHTDQVFADNRRILFHDLNNVGVPREINVGRIKSVSIQDGENQVTIMTLAKTVGEAVGEANIQLFAADSVTPGLGEWIEPNLNIVIERAQPITIRVDGKELQTRSHHENVLDVLAESGIGLVGADYIRPNTEGKLQPNRVIEVVRVREDYLFEDTPLPYESVWQPSELLEIDQTGIVQAGQPGIYRRQTKIRYEDGIEIERIPDGEWVEQAPQNEIFGYGTKIVVRTLDTPDGPIEYWRKVRMRVTSYTAATSGKARSDPWYGITASGLRARKGIVAIDRAIIPWMTNVYVEDYGTGLAGDVGGSIIGRWIDLGYGENNFRSWSGYTDVYYQTPVPEPERINYLLPQWLP